MKNMSRVCILILLLCFMAGTASAVTNCGDEACYIISCNSLECNLLLCDGGFCTVVASWPNPNESAPPDELDGTKGLSSAALASFRSERIVVKTCNQLQCSVYGIEAGEATLLGRFDNISAVIDEIAQDFLIQSNLIDR